MGTARHRNSDEWAINLQMNADNLINGKTLAARVRAQLISHIAELKGWGVVPGLAVVLVGNDPASENDVRSKSIQAREVGINCYEQKLWAGSNQSEILTLIDRLNADPAVHGIALQQPLPVHLHGSGWLGLSAGDAGKAARSPSGTAVEHRQQQRQAPPTPPERPGALRTGGQYRYGRGFNPAGLIPPGCWRGPSRPGGPVYDFVIGFPLGFLALMRGLVLLELLSPRWDDYPAASVGDGPGASGRRVPCPRALRIGRHRQSRRPVGEGKAGDRRFTGFATIAGGILNILADERRSRPPGAAPPGAERDAPLVNSAAGIVRRPRPDAARCGCGFAGHRRPAL